MVESLFPHAGDNATTTASRKVARKSYIKFPPAFSIDARASRRQRRRIVDGGVSIVYGALWPLRAR
jgi:hypothetical protein